MQYRRSDVSGATYFFTVNLAERHRLLLCQHIDLLRTEIKRVRDRHPFYIEAMVVLPDHLHALWRMPEDDADFPMRWNLIKAGFSRQLSRGERISQSRRGKGERGIWQRRYWEHCIQDENDFNRHVDYIHYNPVKHAYVQQAVDWPFSSIHRFINKGILSRDWGSAAVDETDEFGEMK